MHQLLCQLLLLTLLLHTCTSGQAATQQHIPITGGDGGGLFSAVSNVTGLGLWVFPDLDALLNMTPRLLRLPQLAKEGIIAGASNGAGSFAVITSSSLAVQHPGSVDFNVVSLGSFSPPLELCNVAYVPNTQIIIVMALTLIRPRPNIYSATLHRSVDGGVSWTAQRVKWYNRDIAPNCSLNVQQDLALAGWNELFVSTDNGVVWTPQPGGAYFLSLGRYQTGPVYFGRVGSYIKVWSGAGWGRMLPPTPAAAITSIASTSDNETLVAIDSSIDIWRTTTGGTMWVKARLPSEVFWLDCAYLADDLVVAVGYNRSDQAGMLAYSLNGAPWVVQYGYTTLVRVVPGPIPAL